MEDLFRSSIRSSIENLDYPKDEYEVFIVDEHSTE
jgi:hypothetical protein